MSEVRAKLGSKMGLFLAGLVLGALLLAVSPVGAHHNDTKFKKRLAALETKVTKLTKKTQYLASDGSSYNGFVFARYVWANAGYGCTAGEGAQFIADPDFVGDVMLACEGGVPATASSAMKAGGAARR